MRKSNGLAIVLILIGITILLGNTGLLGGEITLFIISLAFFGGYFMSGGPSSKGSIGLLIPACIVLMIGLFTFMQDNLILKVDDGGIFFLMLGTGFFMIYFIHNLRRKELGFGEKNWPAITGTALYVFGTLVFLLENYDLAFARIILQNLWPIGLIVAGFIIIYKNFSRQKRL